MYFTHDGLIIEIVNLCEGNAEEGADPTILVPRFSGHF